MDYYKTIATVFNASQTKYSVDADLVKSLFSVFESLQEKPVEPKPVEPKTVEPKAAAAPTTWSRTDWSHLSKLDGGAVTKDNWRQWVDEAATSEARRQRLSIVRRSDVAVEEAAAMEKQIREMRAKGLDDARRVVTPEEASDVVRDVDERFFKPRHEISPLTQRTRYLLFGVYLPVRRAGDLAYFRVVDGDHPADTNSYSKRDKTLHFCVFKNVSDIGPQTFTRADIERFWHVPNAKQRLDAAYAFLDAQPDGWEINRAHNASGVSVYTKRATGHTSNAFRHHLESVVAPRLKVGTRAGLRYWLCHGAGAAETFYTEDVGGGEASSE